MERAQLEPKASKPQDSTARCCRLHVFKRCVFATSDLLWGLRLQLVLPRLVATLLVIWEQKQIKAKQSKAKQCATLQSKAKQNKAKRNVTSLAWKQLWFIDRARAVARNLCSHGSLSAPAYGAAVATWQPQQCCTACFGFRWCCTALIPSRWSCTAHVVVRWR